MILNKDSSLDNLTIIMGTHKHYPLLYYSETHCSYCYDLW